MNGFSLILVVAIFLLSCTGVNRNDDSPADVTLIKLGIVNDQISQDWRDALERRHSKAFLDSLSEITRPLDDLEQGWVDLIQSKLQKWSTFKDSLEVPFTDVEIADTVYVLLGYLGRNDGFTYQLNTVCFDLTALASVYGEATKPVNDNRMDRLFAHEYTHLIHKKWALEHSLKPAAFKDSILWECLYEGIGMYRSLSSRWWPQGDTLPDVTKEMLDKLNPVFASRMLAINQIHSPTEDQKDSLHHRLSMGPVAKKWGAMPVAVWMMLEADGDHRNLRAIIDEGPEGVLRLAQKYLDEENRAKLQHLYE